MSSRKRPAAPRVQSERQQRAAEAVRAGQAAGAQLVREAHLTHQLRAAHAVGDQRTAERAQNALRAHGQSKGRGRVMAQEAAHQSAGFGAHFRAGLHSVAAHPRRAEHTGIGIETYSGGWVRNRDYDLHGRPIESRNRAEVRTRADTNTTHLHRAAEFGAMHHGVVVLGQVPGRRAPTGGRTAAHPRGLNRAARPLGVPEARERAANPHGVPSAAARGLILADQYRGWLGAHPVVTARHPGNAAFHGPDPARAHEAVRAQADANARIRAHQIAERLAGEYHASRIRAGYHAHQRDEATARGDRAAARFHRHRQDVEIARRDELSNRAHRIFSTGGMHAAQAYETFNQLTSYYGRPQTVVLGATGRRLPRGGATAAHPGAHVFAAGNAAHTAAHAARLQREIAAQFDRRDAAQAASRSPVAHLADRTRAMRKAHSSLAVAKQLHAQAAMKGDAAGQARHAANIRRLAAYVGLGKLGAHPGAVLRPSGRHAAAAPRTGATAGKTAHDPHTGRFIPGKVT